jgi:hypothetical protein
MSKADRSLVVRQMDVNLCPYNAPVLIAGGIAMKVRTPEGSYWVTGMAEPLFTRKLNWEPEWWACIPQQNDKLPTY